MPSRDRAGAAECRAARIRSRRALRRRGVRHRPARHSRRRDGPAPGVAAGDGARRLPRDRQRGRRHSDSRSRRRPVVGARSRRSIAVRSETRRPQPRAPRGPDARQQAAHRLRRRGRRVGMKYTTTTAEGRMRGRSAQEAEPLTRPFARLRATLSPQAGRGLILAALALLFAVNAHAGAAAAQSEEKELTDLLTIVQQETDVATKTRLNSDYVPGIVTVLEGDELEALGVRTAGEALGLV